MNVLSYKRLLFTGLCLLGLTGATLHSEDTAPYAKMSFGFNDCDVEFGGLYRNISKVAMVKLALKQRANGFTYHERLRYGKVMLGEYPMDCQSQSQFSWPLYLKTSTSDKPAKPKK